MLVDRRNFLKNTAGGVLAAAGGLVLPKHVFGASPTTNLNELPAGTVASAVLESLPGKRPLIKRSYRPPNFETPVEYFNEIFTPNDAFFVRYHLSNIPEVSADSWRLKIGGDAAQKPFELTLEQLKRDFEQVEIAAVCMCSGNRRGLSVPHVPGVEWAHGAMGNARWKGVRLRDVLNKAGIAKETVEVAFDGSDRGVLDATPDFVKSIPAWKALDENTLIAYEMNGAPLPHWNGFPARIIVPGWTATYWMKHVTSITLLTQPFKGFWVNTAYRIPKGKFPITQQFVSQENETTTPITEMVVNSLITNLKPNQTFRLGQPVVVKGIAWDSGYGIRLVEVSTDGGMTWRDAQLEKDYGRFSWRQWSYAFKPSKKGSYSVLAKASNSQGASQTFEWIFNAAGYHNNVVQQIAIAVT
ncbi:MAG: molybdopterin-dependent oxidoreductase [Gammaproteobacteria bacterium]|nr:molybdopterin-dependent oxidoreductase [Gammaproteobacteria bacterium]